MTIDAKCPYMDKDCPKIQDLENELFTLKDELKTISRYMYLIIGMIAVNWGIDLW